MELAWIVLGAIGALVVVVGLVRFAAAVWPQHRSTDLPATPLERLGWTGLWVTTAVGLGLVVLVALNGATGSFENDASRLIFSDHAAGAGLRRGLRYGASSAGPKAAP